MSRARRALALVALLVTTAPMAAADARGPGTRTMTVEGAGSYTDANAAMLATMLKGRPFLLINVHVPYEGEIDGTDLLAPFDQIEANLRLLPSDRHARIVLYCRSGRMSTIAAQTLVKLGYTDVWNLDGGMVAWARAGRPLLHRR